VRSTQGNGYTLDELGWLQFERLCAELLELDARIGLDGWRGRADESVRTTLAAEGLTVPGTDARLAGPTLVAVTWVRPLRRENVAERLEREAAAAPGAASLLLLTNLDLARHEVGWIETAVRPLEVAALGRAELSALVDARPDLRRRVPSVLGVRELSELIANDLVQRSTADLAAARALARVFVPTRAYARALRVLERHRFAVLTGPPEMGKTAIARTIGLALMTEGWELHECTRPDELWSRFARDRAQIFVADDAFGSTEYRPEAAELWALELDRVLRAMDERHWLLWTSRPSPLKAGLRRIHREHGVERFPQPAEVQVAASDLDVEEKALILFRHTKSAHAPVAQTRLVQDHGWEIVSHPHFTPERIRRFVAHRLPELGSTGAALSRRELAEAVQAEIREPTKAMATSLRALPPEHRALLVALLDTPAGPVPERELAAAARRHADSGFPRPPTELVDRLTDHFVRVVPPTSVTWVHPSWRDLVIDEIAADAAARRRFLERCSVDGVLLALSTEGGAAGERRLPLLVDDVDWDTLADRLHALVPDLADTDLHRVLAALSAVPRAGAAAHERAELQALAKVALDSLARRLAVALPPIDAGLLDGWLEVASGLAEPPPLPDVRASWIELLPAEVDIGSPTELRALDEWLRLAAILRRGAPELARELGFPERHVELLRQLVDDAAGLLVSRSPAPALLAGCLRRLAVAAPEVAPGAAGVAARLDRAEEPSLPFEFPADPWAGVPTADLSIVARILSDLEPHAA
jgi:hypothetical protein